MMQAESGNPVQTPVDLQSTAQGASPEAGAQAAPAERASPLAEYQNPALSLVEERADYQPIGGPVEKIFFRTGGQTDIASKTDGAFLLTFWFSVFFSVLLMGLMIYWVIRYRRRPGVPAEASPAHNGPLEILWTVVPSSSLLVMFIVGFDGYMEKMVAPPDAIPLHVTGQKWDWNITYPDGEQSAYFTTIGTKVDSVKIFVLPEDTPIKLIMTSKDVIHSFWVPEYRTKMDLYPNRYTTYTFHTEELNPGEKYRDHWIFCAEYCGNLHSQMYGLFRVVSRDAYTQILNDWNTGNLTPAEHGQLIYKTHCISCHTVDGAAGLGPTWKNLYGHEAAISGGGTVLVDENYILESVWYPQKKIVAGFEGQNMTSFAGTLSESEVSAVIAYMQTLSDQGGHEEEAPGGPAGAEPQEPNGD
jgi:cytochrome c oxidase subunit 2